MTMDVSAKLEPAIAPRFRICDSESTQYKLLYRIRTGHIADGELDRVQAQCASELRELRSELDRLLQELRESVRSDDRQKRESIAA